MCDRKSNHRTVFLSGIVPDYTLHMITSKYLKMMKKYPTFSAHIRVFLNLSDVTSCTVNFDLDYTISFWSWILSWKCLHFVEVSTFCGNIHAPWIYPRSVDIIWISWKYPRSLDIIRAHNAVVGHITSTRYSTLYTAPYYPLQYRTTHCTNSVPFKSIHFSGCPSLSRILELACGSPDSQDS